MVRQIYIGRDETIIVRQIYRRRVERTIMVRQIYIRRDGSSNIHTERRERWNIRFDERIVLFFKSYRDDERTIMVRQIYIRKDIVK